MVYFRKEGELIFDNRTKLMALISEIHTNLYKKNRRQ